MEIGTIIIDQHKTAHQPSQDDTSSSARVAIVEFKIHNLNVQKVKEFRPTSSNCRSILYYTIDLFFLQMLKHDYSMQSLQILNFKF